MARRNKGGTLEPVPEKPETAPKQEKKVLTDEQFRALLVHAAGKIAPILTEMGELKAELGRQYKLAKADGITREALNLYLSLSNADSIAVKAEAELRAKITEWLHPGAQAEMFAQFDSDPNSVANQKGVQAGLEGQVCKPPYDIGSAVGQQWIDGWAHGQAQLSSRIGELKANIDADDENTDLRPAFLRNKESPHQTA